MSARLPPLFLAPRLHADCTTRHPPRALRPSAPPSHPSRPSPAPHPSCPPPARPFQTSAPHRQKPLPDHYATLQVAPSASSTDIKKSFYALSKQHHPDRTRTLPAPEAQSHSRAFRSASEAYAVLSDPTARAAYDRARGPPAPSSSSSSAARAPERGGRPASGLSKRRTPFRGPPPSFYAAGGWGGGAAAERRRASAEGTAGQQQQQQRAQQQQHSKKAQDDDPWPFDSDANDVPHFNRRRHFRTQSTVEAQLRQGRAARRQGSAAARQRQALEEEEEDVIYPQDAGPTELRNFFIVGGIVLFGCGGSAVFFGTR